MAKIVNFTVQEFLKQEDQYYTMLNMVKNRVDEILQDFGIFEEGWHNTDVDIYESDFDEFYVNTMLKNEAGKQKRFSFDARWLFSDDYKSQAENTRKQKQAKREESEYQEYLRLKAKFENNT